MIQRSLTALAIALALAAGLFRGVAAQDASPTAVPASACTVEPIAFERLSAVIASPVASPVAADAAATPSATPEGQPADAETTASIQAQVQLLTACINAGDLLRSLAIYSDRFISEAFGGQPITREQYDQQLSATDPRPEGSEIVIVEFGDVVILPDGRAAVSIVGDDLSSPGPPSATVFTFVQENGEWRIDSTYDASTGEETTG